MPEFQFPLTDLHGRNFILKDRGYLSENVSGPLISSGNLFRNGRTIGRQEDNPVLVRRSGISISIRASFKNDSVVIQARFRGVEQDQHARALEVDVPPTWFRTVNNYPVIRTNGNRLLIHLSEQGRKTPIRR